MSRIVIAILIYHRHKPIDVKMEGAESYILFNTEVYRFVRT
jgi:hypothetical protein